MTRIEREWILNPVACGSNWLDFTVADGSALWRWDASADTITGEEGDLWPASSWCDEYGVDHDELVSTLDIEKSYVTEA